MARILVAGSYNASMTVVAPTLPRAGQTVLGDVFRMDPGGKGANQAIGAARLGAEVSFAARLGSDGFADDAIALFEAEGVNGPMVAKVDGLATGVALIMVDESGANQIAVAGGANATLAARDVPRETVVGHDVVLCQLETPVQVFVELAHVAREAHVTTILNPAPAATLPDDVLGLVDFLTPNETELHELTGMPVGTVEEIATAARTLVDRGVASVIVTLGEAGALWVNADRVAHYEAPVVSAIDTTGAGDAFNAGLAVGLASGWNVPDAIALGIRCGSFCVTREGVVDGLPYRNDVDG